MNRPRTHLLYITILMCKHFAFSRPNTDNSTFGMFSIEKDEFSQHWLMHAFYDYNMTDCYVLYLRETMKFMTASSTEMSLNDSVNLCKDPQSTSNWNSNCVDKVLRVSHIPLDRCSLESGDILNLCVVFFKMNHEVYQSFYCRMKLGWLHSKGIVFDERLYFNHCPDSNIPVYLLHFGFHTLDIYLFMNKTECEKQRFSFMQPYQDDEEEGNETVTVIQAIHTGVYTPVCVMEKGMKNPLHCQIPFEQWRDERRIGKCPPSECMAESNVNKTYDCIPFIQKEICRSEHIHEGAVCWLNKTEQLYDMCKAITPHEMTRKLRDPHFHELSATCYYHLYPEKQGQLTMEDLNDLFFIPLDSRSRKPLIESSCLDIYKYMLPRIKETPNKMFWVKEIGTKGTDDVVLNVMIGFLCLGGIVAVLNIILVLQMRRNDYNIIAVDIHIIFIVVFLTTSLICETVMVALSGQVLPACFKQYYTVFLAFLRDTVYLFLIALSYDRTYAIARPLMARSTLTKKRAKLVCIYITLSTFIFRVLQGIVTELEHYFYQEKMCVTGRDKTWYKSAIYIMMLINGIAYGLAWLFILLVNIVLGYNLARNAKKWKREVPFHQVVSIVGVSICHLIFSSAIVNSHGILPIVYSTALSRESSAFQFLLKFTEMEKYRIISICINSIQHLMIGGFLLGFTPKYKDMIVKCLCAEKPENTLAMRRRGRQMEACEEDDGILVEVTQRLPNQAVHNNDNQTESSNTDQKSRTTVFVDVEVHVKPCDVDAEELTPATPPLAGSLHE